MLTATQAISHGSLSDRMSIYISVDDVCNFKLFRFYFIILFDEILSYLLLRRGFESEIQESGGYNKHSSFLNFHTPIVAEKYYGVTRGLQRSLFINSLTHKVEPHKAMDYDEFDKDIEKDDEEKSKAEAKELIEDLKVRRKSRVDLSPKMISSEDIKIIMEAFKEDEILGMYD